MRGDYRVEAATGGGWIVARHLGSPLAQFRRRRVAEAYGRALAHREKVALVVHHSGDRQVRYSDAELTYARTI